MFSGLARSAMGAAQKWGPTMIENAPAMLNGAASLINTFKGREQQDMFLGSLLGAGLSALPGVLNGVGGIINAAKGRE